MVLTGKDEAATLERAQLLQRCSRGVREPVPREEDCCGLLGEPLCSPVPRSMPVEAGASVKVASDLF